MKKAAYRLAGRDVPTGGDGGHAAVIESGAVAGVAANMAGLLLVDGQSPDSKNHHHLTGDAGTVFGPCCSRGFMAIILILTACWRVMHSPS